jgi:prepilin-type N-terminal cleavage/methylation domain-containing protein
MKVDKKLGQKKLGFSLIELSVVMLIIAALMLAVLKGSDLIDEAKLAVARQQTANSPVWDINGLVSWYETTMKESFNQDEVVDGGAITVWNDISSSDDNSGDAISSGSPTYELGSLNDLPTMRFNGGQHFTVSDGELMGSLTIFIVMRFDADTPNCISVISSVDGWSEAAEHLGSTHLILNCGGSGTNINYAVNVIDLGGDSGYTNTNIEVNDGEFHLINIIEDLEALKYLYVDGGNLFSESRTVVDKKLAHYTIGAWNHGDEVVTIDRFLQGNIAEIIIFNRDLNTQEREDVERYLSNKWAIELAS